MISKKFIKEMDFNNIVDIYKYIIESYINGNYAQFKELINKLSHEQFKDFYFSIDDYVEPQKQNIFRKRVIEARY